MGKRKEKGGRDREEQKREKWRMKDVAHA